MKKRYIYLLLTVLYILAGSLCRAQENTMVRTRELADTLTIYFPLNQYTFDPSYMGNKVNMDMAVTEGKQSLYIFPDLMKICFTVDFS